MRTLFEVGGAAVIERADRAVEFTAEFTVNADGSPRAYGPPGTDALDYLANAGRPGNWWGIATHNGEPSGKPIVQGPNDPYPGYYVSTTAYKVPGYRNGDPRRELDSEKHKFIVVPRQLIRAVRGIVLGCRARVTDTRSGRSADGIVGDIGPRTHLGEASIAMASAIGVPPGAKRGGSAARVFRYELWPGVGVPGYVLQARKGYQPVLDAVEVADYATA